MTQRSLMLPGELSEFIVHLLRASDLARLRCCAPVLATLASAEAICSAWQAQAGELEAEPLGDAAFDTGTPGEDCALSSLALLSGEAPAPAPQGLRLRLAAQSAWWRRQAPKVWAALAQDGAAHKRSDGHGRFACALLRWRGQRLLVMQCNCLGVLQGTDEVGVFVQTPVCSRTCAKGSQGYHVLASMEKLLRPLATELGLRYATESRVMGVEPSSWSSDQRTVAIASLYGDLECTAGGGCLPGTGAAMMYAKGQASWDEDMLLLGSLEQHRPPSFAIVQVDGEEEP